MKILFRLLQLSQMETKKVQIIGYTDQSSLPEIKYTLFRQLFKYYKQRAVDPDLKDVLDLSVSNPHMGILCSAVDISSLSSADKNYLNDENNGFCPPKEWSVSMLTHRPGLYILHNVFTRRRQLQWVKKCLFSYAEPPNVTNLSSLGVYTESEVFRNCGQKLRWVTMGFDYDWSHKKYADRPRQSLPVEIARIGEIIARCLNIGKMEPDAAIINFYPAKANLSPHVDKSERDLSRPLITISLGQSAVYLTGGTELNDPVDAIILSSGDVLVMYGAQRSVYHAVPRIFKTTRFDNVKPDWGIEREVWEYANECRINMTIRQVDS